jgi:hypothetical protein
MQRGPEPRRRQRVEILVDPTFVEQGGRRLGIESEALDLGLPQLVEPRIRPVVVDPLHHRRGLEQGIIRLERRRAMARCAAHPQLAPGDALLADRDIDERAVTRPRVLASALGQHVVGADRLASVVGHPLHPVGATGFLVGDGEVDQIALGAEPRAYEVAEGDGHRRREVEHVDRATAPHLAVDQLAAERVAAPAGLVDRHHVGVAHQAEARRVGVGALDPGDERRPTRGWLVLLEVEP